MTPDAHPAPRPTGRGRSALDLLLVGIASAAVLLALLAGYTRRAAVDSEQFSNRASAVLSDDSVRSLIADRITDELILANQSDLLAARPLIQSVVSAVVGGQAFTGAFRLGVRDVHRAVFDRDQNTLTLAVADIGTIVGAALQAIRPRTAESLKEIDKVELVTRDIGEASGSAARLADAVRLLAPLLLLLAVLATAAAVYLSADRRRTVVRLGIGIAVAGGLLVVALAVTRARVLNTVEAPEARAAAAAVWDAFLGDLRGAAWLLAGSGVVVAASAASLIRPVDIDAPLRRAVRLITTEPARPAFKVLRALGLVAAGLLFVLDRETVLHLAFTLAGLYLIYAGVAGILRLVYEPRADRAPAAHEPGAWRGRNLAAAGVAAAVVIGATAVFVGTGGTSAAAPAAGPCNGHVELCDRSLPEVAMVATHNSMSVPLAGWYASVQDDSIAAQLADGVHGFLIDTHYAERLANGRLRTEVGDPEQLRRKAEQDGVSPDAVDAALRLRERVGFAGEGERDMYLCHSFCELGGTLLSEVLEQLHDFLVANPGEVVVIVNQDYVTPADFVGAVREAGLEEMAYRGPTSGRWPTLRRMVETNQRILFLAENRAGAAPWYHLAYESITEETPFAFSRPEQLTDPAGIAATCRPNRGPEGAPIFLVNHWITTDPLPLPSHADAVNAYERSCGGCGSASGCATTCPTWWR